MTRDEPFVMREVILHLTYTHHLLCDGCYCGTIDRSTITTGHMTEKVNVEGKSVQEWGVRAISIKKTPARKAKTTTKEKNKERLQSMQSAPHNANKKEMLYRKTNKGGGGKRVARRWRAKASSATLPLQLRSRKSWPSQERSRSTHPTRTKPRHRKRRERSGRPTPSSPQAMQPRRLCCHCAGPHRAEHQPPRHASPECLRRNCH